MEKRIWTADFRGGKGEGEEKRLNIVFPKTKGKRKGSFPEKGKLITSIGFDEKEKRKRE